MQFLHLASMMIQETIIQKS